MENIALIAFTEKGCRLATRIAEGLGLQPAEAVSGPERFAGSLGVRAYGSLASWTKEHFGSEEALVFVGASGIAVRAIAPHVKDKFHDPAVVSVDEAGGFVVPLLSGHVGGANELARTVARIVGAQVAVSTATDVNGLFAVDEWAARHNLAIKERAVAKAISAALLEGRPVGFASDFAAIACPEAKGVVDCTPACKRPGGADGAGEAATDTSKTAGSGDSAPTGVCKAGALPVADLGFVVSLDDGAMPFERTLHLVPRVVTVGVGCRRDTLPETLRQAVDEALRRARVSPRAVVRLASIDVKSDEPAILNLAAERGWELRFYTADELSAVPGDFTASAFVKRTVGVDNVCERSALAEGGALILGKQPHDGTTVAIASQLVPDALGDHDAEAGGSPASRGVSEHASEGAEPRLAACDSESSGSVMAESLDSPEARQCSQPVELLVFGGTSEGRELTEWLSARGTCEVVTSAATEYGGELVSGLPHVQAHVGPLDAEGKRRLVAAHDFACIVDATHPFATHVSESLATLAQEQGIPLLRLVRDDSSASLGAKQGARATESRAEDPCSGLVASSPQQDDLPVFTIVSTVEEASRLLAGLPGNILLTTGSKDLATFTAAVPDFAERLYARVLPVPSSVEHARELGIPASRIVAMQGPFSAEFNVALMRELDIRVMVTKASGSAGGFDEKMQAARECGAHAIVIGRPRAEQGLSLDGVKRELQQRFGV